VYSVSQFNSPVSTVLTIHGRDRTLRGSVYINLYAWSLRNSIWFVGEKVKSLRNRECEVVALQQDCTVPGFTLELEETVFENVTFLKICKMNNSTEPTQLRMSRCLLQSSYLSLICNAILKCCILRTLIINKRFSWTNRLRSFDTTRRAQKTTPPMLRWRRYVFAELLPSNDWRIHRPTDSPLIRHASQKKKNDMSNNSSIVAGTCLPSRCLAPKGGIHLTELLTSNERRDTHTDRLMGGIFFLNSFPSYTLIRVWRFSFILLIISQSVGLLDEWLARRKAATCTQDNTNTEKRIHTKLPCLAWDSNPRSRLPSERWECIP
jgi:hypothetical protein